MANRIETIFQKATEIESREERNEWLHAHFAAEPDLIVEVQRLLRAHDRADEWIDQPVIDQLVSHPSEPEELPCSTMLGPYRLLQVIGRGGMGIVYMAEQTEPVNRRVAVKIVRSELAGKTVLARFAAEQQALALMDHPQIARVFDAGKTDDGRPWFVMELVRGLPITDYCDRAQMPLRDRIGLFITVCEGIQHAHQKGIIHRDLKPSNVLVTEYDDTPVARIIDFGVAKAVGRKLTERTLFTDFASVIGTLEYMSPEQAGLNQLDVDTRSDIYSLGVILYELLTGSTPLDADRVRQSTTLDVLQAIRDVDPPTPSRRISTSSAAPQVAAHRAMDVRRLGGVLRGDLDWIAMKALERNRQRRYQSAGELADDLRRYLECQPVSAGPPTWRYRCTVFLRRNRTVSMMAGLLILAVIAGLIGLGYGWTRTRQLLVQEQALRQEVESQRSESEQVSSMLESLFSDLDVYATDTDLRSVLRDRMKAAAQAIADQESLDPLRASRLAESIARTLIGIGDYAEAEPLLQFCCDIRREQLGVGHAATLDARHLLAYCLSRQERHAEALAGFQAIVGIRSELLGPKHPDTLRTRLNIANCLLYLGQRQQAAEELARLNQLREEGAVLHESDRHTILTWLATQNIHTGQTDDALAALQDVVAIRTSQFGEHHPRTLDSLSNLGMLLEMSGRDQDALQVYQQLLNGRSSRLGDRHNDTLTARRLLALCHHRLGNRELEIPLWSELVEAVRENQHADPARLARYQLYLGGALVSLSRHDEARELLEECWHWLTLERPDSVHRWEAQYLLAMCQLSGAAPELGVEMLTNAFEFIQGQLTTETSEDFSRLADQIKTDLIQHFEKSGQTQAAERWRSPR
ncbi:MAG TPA: serine/threonine-protein kinase [Pirellulaceae bacterium]|nr:serine/threonine-protein kinase [Pirellulaceae bacterium]HMP78716.1 serine/threonine-protein kinase [Pirellulaceae bacterium]